MKKIKHITIFLALCVFSISLFAQTNIKVSTEKVKINGEIYYVHPVKKGETIYSICLAYGISQDELIKENPELKDGLKSGQSLKIPDKYCDLHLQRNANKKQEEIITKQDLKITDVTFKKHKVKKKETLETIARKYYCTVADLKKCNPDIDESKLKKGQYLNIPSNVQYEKEIKIVAKEETPKRKDFIEKETAKDKNCCKKQYDGEVMNVSLLLPLQANRNMSNLTKSENNYLDFYEGFLLALDSVKNCGISVELSVFDVFDKSTMDVALHSKLLKKSDLIIGPVHDNLMIEAAGYAEKNEIPIVSPLDPKTENIARTNEYFIQAPTPVSLQMQRLSDYLCAENGNFIVVYDDEKDLENYNSVITALNNCGKKVKKYKYVIVGSRNDEFVDLLIKSEKNNVCIASNSEVFVTDVLSKLNSFIAMKYDIFVYGSSRWETAFFNLNLEHFYNLKTTVTQAYYVDYNSENVKNFIRKYRYYYKGEPSQFSFQGYDLGLFFINEIAKYGKKNIDCISNENTSYLLQTKYKFERILPSGGLVNTSTFILKHTPEMNIIAE